MSSSDPLKSAIPYKIDDETSLALPSKNQYGSGEQRVRAQVQTIRRIKSRHSSSGRSGSTSLSPTSPVYDSVFLDGVKSPLSLSFGSVFQSNGFSKNLTTDLNKKTMNNHHTSSNFTKSTVRKHTLTSGHRYESGYGAIRGAATLGLANTSRSEPGLAMNNYVPQPSVPALKKSSTEHWGNRNTYMKQHGSSQFIKRTVSQPHPLQAVNGSGLTQKHSQYRVSQPDMSKTHMQQTVTDSSLKTKINSGTNGNIANGNITMKEAVQFLSNNDENYQNCGASYIQHNTFIDDKAKDEVLKLNGIAPLVGLLLSPSSQVKHTASAALRNLSFKNDKNKEEIYRCEGIAKATAQLRDSDSVELDKQLTGLLWNLSSADSLKPELLKHALPALMEHVILPYKAGSIDTTNDPDVFCNATGCLRNLSSSKESSRQTMRKCRGLIDSLTAHLQYCVENGKTDESLVNCVGILHNLTFQLEEELPSLFTNMNALAKNYISSVSPSNASPVGCFSTQSKTPQMERPFDYAVIEDPQPKGAGLLIHSNTLKDYLTLLRSSEREDLLEASCGALHNLTAHDSIVSNVISQIIVQKLNGMQFISPLLKSNKVNMQKSAMGLVLNLIKNPSLHRSVGRKTLPELLGLLTKGPEGVNQSDDTLSYACQAASGLVLNDPELTKMYLNNSLINSLSSISSNMYFPKSSRSAAVLLVKIWSDKELQSYLKKHGMNKHQFVNDTTMAAHRSLQVVD